MTSKGRILVWGLSGVLIAGITYYFFQDRVKNTDSNQILNSLSLSEKVFKSAHTSENYLSPNYVLAAMQNLPGATLASTNFLLVGKEGLERLGSDPKTVNMNEVEEIDFNLLCTNVSEVFDSLDSFKFYYSYLSYTPSSKQLEVRVRVKEGQA